MAYNTPNMGLKTFNLLTDLYDHNAVANNNAIMDGHDHTSGKGVQIPTGGLLNGAVTNSKLALGSVDAPNLTNALAQSATVNESGQTVKGAANIPASQSTSSTSYTLLSTPDQVQNIVLPANGLFRVWYQATWQESIVGGARAAIFIGSNQLRILSAAGVPPMTTQSAQLTLGTVGALANVNRNLFSCPIGLASITSLGDYSYSPDVTTGQVVGAAPGPNSSIAYFFDTSGGSGGFGAATGQPGVGVGGASGSCDIFAAAGTYTVSVQFMAIGGSVTASNRKLWVQALSFS